MPLRSCDHQSCVQPADRTFGSCMICSSHRCSEHAAAPIHCCPLENVDPNAYYTALDAAQRRHLLNQLNRIDARALVSAASKARNGLQCTVPALSPNAKGELNLELVQSQMGGQNCHVDINFEDGTVWLARIRLDDPLLPPLSTQKYIFASEIATLKFLESTRVPSPKVYGHAPESSANPVGVSYVLMEKLSGAPLQWNEMTSRQRTRVMSQLVDIFLELERHPLPKQGSLVLDRNALKVGGFAQSCFFSSPEQTLGPFETLEASLHYMITQQQDQILNGELSSFAVDNYLSHCWRRDMIDQVISHCQKHRQNGEPSFYLRHFDDKGDHILIDSSFNITAIIDWEFASFEPKSLAFGTPCMLWPVIKYFEGSNELSAEEIELADLFETRGRKDMGKLVRECRKMQRFTYFAASGGVGCDLEEFKAQFNGLRAAWSEDEQISSYEDWKRDAVEKYRGDERLQFLSRGN